MLLLLHIPGNHSQAFGRRDVTPGFVVVCRWSDLDNRLNCSDGNGAGTRKPASRASPWRPSTLRHPGEAGGRSLCPGQWLERIEAKACVSQQYRPWILVFMDWSARAVDAIFKFSLVDAHIHHASLLVVIAELRFRGTGNTIARPLGCNQRERTSHHPGLLSSFLCSPHTQPFCRGPRQTLAA